MKVLLISPYSDIASIGLRIIAACARDAGYDVLMAFVPNTPDEESRLDDGDHTYPPTVSELLADLAAACDVVGITVMTNYVHRAAELTRIARQKGSPVIVWGGIHPTVQPAECLKIADYVVIGEGEEAFCDLLAALETQADPCSIPNIACRTGDTVHCADARPLKQDLDTLPFPDYGPENHYVWDREAGGLVPMTLALLEKHLALGPISRIRRTVTYQTMATRGCPHRCAYCCNDALQELYKGQTHLRRRSYQNVLDEISTAIQKYPFISGVGFSDDSFFVASDSSIEQFAVAYRQHIGLPFFCLGSPLTITERKLVALLDAGMYGLQMGVQTGSPRIQALYNRPISNKKVLEAVNLLHRYSDRMVPPTYDFIIDSPWETPADITETLQLVRQFPRPYRLQLFSLVIFPGTALYHKAVAENRFDSGMAEKREYHKRQAIYPNIVLGLYRHNIPKPILDALSHPAMVKIFHRKIFNPLYRVFYALARMLNRVILKKK